MSLLLHCHHNTLIEPADGTLTERRDYIRRYKPRQERPIRLMLLRVVTEAEIGLLPLPIRKSLASLTAAQAARDAARAKWDATRAKDAWHIWHVTRDEHVAADARYIAALTKHHGALEVWHKQVCLPDCPWDGTTIFPVTA